MSASADDVAWPQNPGGAMAHVNVVVKAMRDMADVSLLGRTGTIYGLVMDEERVRNSCRMRDTLRFYQSDEIQRVINTYFM